MKKTKILYGLLFVAALFVVVVIIANVKAPSPGEKTAQATNCVPSLLTGQTLVNGLGPDVQIPLFPGAKRLTFTDVTAVQYMAKAYDSDIKSFYDGRLTSLCWEIKAQNRDQVVYKNNGKELKLSLLPNPAGKTVIDFVVTTTEGVLGTIRIADHVAACTSDQYFCNGGCVANGTSCPAPTSASSCTGGTIWCASSSGSGGWCQMAPCPSSTSTTPSSSTCGSSQWWCNGACIAMTTTCNGYYPNGTTSSSGTASGSTTACTGTYQQPGVSYTQCNNSLCPSGCTWDGNGCPSGCYSSSSATSCPSGQYICNGGCISNTTSCGSSSTTTTTSTGSCSQYGVGWHIMGDNNCYNSLMTEYRTANGTLYSCSTTPASGCSSSSTTTGDANSCPSFGYSRWDSSNRRYCQLNNEFRCDYNYPSYLTNGANYTAANCPAGSTNTSSGYTSGCTSTQYLCNGTCVATGTACSSQAWPTDQASCTSQAKFWCTGAGSSSSGWCQTTACSTNYSTVTCAAGQWQCNNACIATTASCNGYNYNGTSVTAPSGTTCAGGYTWCASSQSCINAVQPCYPSTTQTQQTQPTTQQQQQQTQPQTLDQTRTNQQQPNNQQFNQDNRQFNQGPSEADMKRQEEQEKRMREQQFQQMKRGMEQFSRGVTQMKRFADRAKARLAKQGVGLPLELTNALAKAPELLAKLKAAKTQEEFEDLMGDMQDIGMIMQEWGPKMGELQRLGGMLSQLDKDVRNMATNFKRIRTAASRRPELADALKELEATLGVMSKKAGDAKILAKSDPEGALELVEDFYTNSEEFWNQTAIVEMVSNVSRGLSQANSEIRRAETRIRALERAKTVDAETIAALKDMLKGIKESLPELRVALAKRPVNYDDVRELAQLFWEQVQEFENLLAEQGQSFYAPTVKSGANIKLDIPEGFLGAPNNSGPQGPGSFEGGAPGGFGPGGF